MPEHPTIDEFCSLHASDGAPLPVTLATHKVGEEFPAGDARALRHNYTNYLCCDCFGRVMGSVPGRECEKARRA